jgi:hypothetical protein
MQNIADSIAQLPVDELPLSPSEIEIVETLFKQEKSKYVKLLNELKETLLVSILVVLFCLVNLTPLLSKISPFITSSEYMIAICKGLLAGFIFYIFKNMDFLKK